MHLRVFCLLAYLFDEHALERVVLARALELDEAHGAVGALAEHAERGEVVELVGLALARQHGRRVSRAGGRQRRLQE